MLGSRGEHHLRGTDGSEGAVGLVQRGLDYFLVILALLHLDAQSH